MGWYGTISPNIKDEAAQQAKKKHHMVQCYDDACVHWVDDKYHWYHTECGADVESGEVYMGALAALRAHMDKCTAGVDD